MQINDEVTEEKSTGFVRIGLVFLFVVLALLAIVSVVRLCRPSENDSVEETPVVCDLQPTPWKGAYILPIPSISVNVASSIAVGPVLHISVALVLPHQSDIKEAQNALPLVKESIILLARGLSAQDVQSPEALYRLKQALLKRVQWVLEPVAVQDVLITGLFLDNALEEI